MSQGAAQPTAHHKLGWVCTHQLGCVAHSPLLWVLCSALQINILRRVTLKEENVFHGERVACLQAQPPGNAHTCSLCQCLVPMMAFGQLHDRSLRQGL